MSVAAPKTQAKEPIQFDVILVCKKTTSPLEPAPSADAAMEAARKKMDRLHAEGFMLSRNDQKIVLFGQLLTTLRSPDEGGCFARVEDEFQPILYSEVTTKPQLELDF
jgi:hypothetical protein